MIESHDKDVFNFIQEILIGIELKIWNELDKDKSKIKTQDAMYLGSSMIEYYLTSIHKSLVDKSDQLIVNTFENFSKNINIENKYILNLITNTITKSYTKLPRSKLNINSKDEFIISLKEILEIMKKYILYVFNEDLKKLIK